MAPIYTVSFCNSVLSCSLILNLERPSAYDTEATDAHFYKVQVIPALQNNKLSAAISLYNIGLTASTITTL